MREKIRFNEEWLFHRGDIETKEPPYKGAAYMQAKTARRLTDPAAYAYNDRPNDYRMDALYTAERWESVTLPHDYVILQAPDPNENCGLGYFKYENAWYRKHFTLTQEDKGRRIALYFEGVATQCEVFVNGCPVGRNFCGYTSFEIDISDFVWFEKPNVVAVYVNTQQHEGWWYEGGGIYRNVWLLKTDPVHIDLYGVYVCPTHIENDKWRVRFETTVANGSEKEVGVTVKTILRAPSGDFVAAAEAALTLGGYCRDAAESFCEVRAPLLWDLDAPNLYTIETTLYLDGEPLDSDSTRTGFRTFAATNDGFILNGRAVKIKGVCAHEDFGLCGKAVPDNIHRYKLQMLKEMGANGYRASHYPQNERIMDALDELGFIAMAETRWFDSSAAGIEQLEMLIKRDRNHPSVFFWSLGNEEPKHRTDEGVRMFRRMRAAVLRLDDTRLITSAVCAPPDKAPIMAELDVIGVNYNTHLYDDIRRLYPDKPIIATESCATSTTRGWYRDDCPELGYMSAYDKDSSDLFRSREFTWNFLAERPYVLGCFQWDGFEHRGESLWPRLCSQAGAIDLFLQKKDAFYQNLSCFGDEPMIHLLPHWNLPAKEGDIVRVVAYTNCEQAELFLGTTSLGTQKAEKYHPVEWKVPYRQKKISVVGYKDGKKAACDSHIRAGAPVCLRLRADTPLPAPANGRDVVLLTCTALDSEGNTVPNASLLARFSANRFGRVIATGSDVCDHEPVFRSERQMRAGSITVAVQVGKEAGMLRVYAEADGLCGAVCDIPLKEED